MKILKVRLNHATNSSSVHSVIRVGDDQLKDTNVDDSFGENKFVASSDDSKQSYFSLILESSLRSTVGEQIAKLVTRDICGLSDGYIDHESAVAIPCGWDEKAPDLDFAEELKQWFLQSDIVILGGSDNDDDHDLLSKYKSSDVLDSLPCYGTRAVCRKDTEGHWTIFYRSTGTKVRISFVDREAPRSEFPELIDIKLTDYCNKGCTYCYQGSTTKGKHSNLNYISSLARQCQAMKVFEVALGGGEPTGHPSFLRILKLFRYYGTVPSFSTRSLEWLKEKDYAERISKACGSWALSVNVATEIDDAMNAIKDIDVKKPAIHIVLGAFPWSQTEELLRTCAAHELRVVLLGFKQTGRGIGFKTHDNSKWIELVDSLKLHTSIDTSLAATYADELEAADVPEWLLERKEGCHSMYIDAVAQTMGPSSFCSEDMMIPRKQHDTPKAISDALKEWSEL